MRFTQVVVVVVLFGCGSLALGKEAKAPVSKHLEPASVGIEGNSAGRARNSAVNPMLPSAAIAYPGGGSASVEMPNDIEQRASCVIQIDGLGTEYPPIGYEGGRGSRFDAPAVALLASSTALSESVVQAALKRKPGLVGRQVLIVAVPSGNRFVRVEVSLKKGEQPWPEDAADKVLNALTERLLNAAKASQTAENAAHAARLADAKEQLAEATARGRELNDSLSVVREALGQPGLMYGDPSNAVQNIRMQAEQIESEIIRQKSRLAMLEDEPLTTAEAQVKAAEKTLAKLTVEARKGQASVESIAEAATNLAEAKDKLADARAQSIANGHVRSNARMEARQIRANIAEQELRLKPLKERLAKLDVRGMSSKLAHYQEQQQEEQRLRQELSQLADRVRAIQRSMRNCSAVTLTVLDGRPKP